jgi:exodeoxyribonuclease VII large subunit
LALNNSLPKQIYSISKLTEKIKLLLEQNFSMIWISGEISNLRIPSSGHAYFTLKDEHAQIAGVMFRGQLRHLKFELDDGLTIVGLGRISVYEPRGTYQIILEYVEPKSAGALQLAFEQLKRKLSQEGLFDAVHKRKPPFLPETVCIISSTTGAVIHDILHVLERRCRGLTIEIIPVRVQGEGAENEIARAIEVANRRARADVIILARGGGSLEDLAAFNSERVARAIFSSSIPIVSGIGHETDYTIADFVADLRAPTPSAAAELIVPVKAELIARCAELRQRCRSNMERMMSGYRDALWQLQRALVHPRRKVQELQQHTDVLTQRMHHMAYLLARQRRMHLTELSHKLLFFNPINHLNRNKSLVEVNRIKILQSMKKSFMNCQGAFEARHAALMALNPRAVLARGYSITRLPHDHRVVTHADSVSKGQALEILLHKGILNVTVNSSDK